MESTGRDGVKPIFRNQLNLPYYIILTLFDWKLPNMDQK